MAITHTAAVRNDLVDTVTGKIDAGTTDATGDCIIQDSGDVEVALPLFANPAFPAAAGGTASANAMTADSNAAGGTAAKFRVRDRDNTEIFNGTVTATGGGGDMELTDISIGAGSTVDITQFDYTAGN